MALPEHVSAKIRVAPNGCWRWTASTDDQGYGRVWHWGKLWLAHRLVWTLTMKRELPPRHDLHHDCRNTSCVNPAHLQLLEVSAHRRLHPPPTELAVAAAAAARKARTHCAHGHEYTIENTYIKKCGARVCRTCQRELMRRRRKGVTV